MGDSQADGESDPRRFDPLAGMRAMADIQAEGLRAASDLLDRVLGAESEAPPARAQAPAADYGALVEVWADLLRRTLASMSASGHSAPMTVAVDTEGVGPAVRLATDGSAPAAVEVWLHNGTTTPRGPLTLRCGPLASASGAVLEHAAIAFEPSEIELLPPRSSRAVTVELIASGPLPVGTYRGTIQAEGLASLWLPLEIAVGPC